MTARVLSKRSASPEDTLRCFFLFSVKPVRLTILFHFGSNIAHELHTLFLSLVSAYGGGVSERFPVRGRIHGDLIFKFIVA
jgi:hypothetical protein